MQIPFLDLKKVNDEIRQDIEQAIQEVVNSGWYILGNKGRDFETKLATSLQGIGKGYAIGCNSGTDALVLALIAAGVEYGDEVITVSMTAIPTITAIRSVGAVPVFIDIDPKTWVMDVAKVKDAVTEKTKAIVPVHLYGNMADIDEIMAVLQRLGRNDITIIEDVAQAQGAELGQRQAGTIGHFGAYSFYPSKNIGALGDGGAVYCQDEKDFETLFMLRNYGQKTRYQASVGKGINSRLDEIQAGILTKKLDYLTDWNKRRCQIMNTYRKELASEPIVFQQVTAGCIPAWHLCVIALETCDQRNELMSYMKEQGVETLIHYPVPNHLQPAFIAENPILLPNTESLSNRILSLPMNVVLSSSEVEFIVSIVRDFFRK